MLIELAIGDAYGMGFEYASAKLVSATNNLSRYFKHPHHNIQPGCYTDDTQMSLAIAEALVSDQPWTPQFLADKFVNAFKRDPREGYSSKFYHLLHQVEDGAQLLSMLEPHSDKSGAAMRACPIGVFASIDQVIEHCSLQAQITHNTPAGIAAANAAALMTHYFLYQLGTKANLGKFLETYILGYHWSQPWPGQVGSKGWMSVQAAVTAIIRNNSLSQILIDCVNFTGDVDTVATIALAAASCSDEIIQDLPEHLFRGLENGRYGYGYLSELDQRLLKKVVPKA